MTDEVTEVKEDEMIEVAQSEESSEVKELPLLTVGQFIKDLADFPQDVPMVAAVEGMPMTIGIKQAVSVTTLEGQSLVILQMEQRGVLRALEHEFEARVQAESSKEVN